MPQPETRIITVTQANVERARSLRDAPRNGTHPRYSVSTMCPLALALQDAGARTPAVGCDVIQMLPGKPDFWQPSRPLASQINAWDYRKTFQPGRYRITRKTGASR